MSSNLKFSLSEWVFLMHLVKKTQELLGIKVHLFSTIFSILMLIEFDWWGSGTHILVRIINFRPMKVAIMCSMYKFIDTFLSSWVFYPVFIYSLNTILDTSYCFPFITNFNISFFAYNFNFLTYKIEKLLIILYLNIVNLTIHIVKFIFIE